MHLWCYPRSPGAATRSLGKRTCVERWPVARCCCGRRVAMRRCWRVGGGTVGRRCSQHTMIWMRCMPTQGSVPAGAAVFKHGHSRARCPMVRRRSHRQMQTMTMRSPSHQGATPSAGARRLSATSITSPLTGLSQLAPPSSARGVPPPRQQTRQRTHCHWSIAVSLCDVRKAA